jgi:AraC-like DNA-binding protein
MATFTYRRAEIFDQIELFSSRDEVSYFPFHFHDFYCVSIITKGVEVLRNTENEFLVPSAKISITQALEVHRNYSLHEAGYDYKTLYVNPDILHYFNDGKKVLALERVIDDPKLYRQLSRIFDDPVINPTHWEDSMRRLVCHATLPDNGTPNTPAFALIDELLEQYPDKPIDSDWLSQQFCMSKFHFIRQFKKAKGVSPQIYIMLYRLRRAKAMLLQQRMQLNEIAYANGFFDPSHFTNSYKKFFGVPPSNLLIK